MVPYVSYALALSLSLRYSRSEAERALPPREEYLSRACAAVIVIRYRRALSAKLEPGTGACDGGAVSIAGKLTRDTAPAGLAKVQSNSVKRSFVTSHEIV